VSECLPSGRDCSAVELEGLAHGGLDVDRLEVVPSLLEEGGKEVNTHKDVLSELFLSHLLVADGDGHAGNLLKLELDGGTGIINLGSEVFVVGDDLGEHTNTVEDGSEDGGDLLDEGVRGKEKGVLLGPCLNELLVLVEGLEELKVNNVDVDVLSLDDINVLGITDQANLEAWSGDVGETDGSSETLILLGVVVLKTDLELNGLGELSLLLVLEDGGEALSNLGVSNALAHSSLGFTLEIYLIVIIKLEIS
jgi:hypothetical protein